MRAARRSKTPAIGLLLVLSLAPALADEGLWTYDKVPVDAIEKVYGFRPDQAWLDRLRLSSLRLGNGCSGAFVSPRGLVQTNHHCARTCVQQLSTEGNDRTADGFYAREQSDEIKCPDLEVDQLTGISDVSERVLKAVAGKDGKSFADALKAEQATIARDCSGNDDAIRCDVVELFQGAVYHLYKYRRYQDLRLVFAPEDAIANFGGDPDNFEFPRYGFDVSYLRIYDNDAPLDSSANFLRYAAVDAKLGDLVFTSGQPGTSYRLHTVATLQFRRDVSLPRSIFLQSELRGVLTQFSAQGAEQARIAKDALYGVENELKANKGQFAALVDPTIIDDRTVIEERLKERIVPDPVLGREYGWAWQTIRTTLDRYRKTRDRKLFTEDGTGFDSQLFGFAKTLVRYAAEAAKPDEERLPEYTDVNFPSVRQSLLSTAPIYPELEKLTLGFSLTKLREVLGPDDPFVKKVLGNKSPTELAATLVDGSALADVELRKRLLDGGAAAVAASTDPMIVLARTIDPDTRAVRRDYDETIEAPLTRANAAVAHAMLKVYGDRLYPDATGTLRISYGAIKGYQQDDKPVEAMTTFGGLFERATGADPFRLPERWIVARPRLDARQPFNVVSTNDILGGNSGSPMVNKAGEVVGLAFDGNRQSLGGEYGYDEAVNRAVSVNVGALRQALAKVYGADRLVKELAE